MSLFFIILTIFLAFFLTLNVSLTAGKPIGSDFWYHLKFAESYARGELALFNEKLMDPNKGPYPPLFHLILVPFVLFGIVVEFAAFLQIFFYPLALFTPVYLVWKRVSISSAAFTAILLFSSIAFFDRSMQVIPQAFDMIFFPLAAYFFLEKRRLPFLVSMSIAIYSHGAYSLILLGSLILYSLKFKVGLKMIRDVLIIAAPLIILTLFFLPSYLGSATQINDPQEKIIREYPLHFFVYLGWVPSVLFFVSLGYYFLKRNGLDEMVVLSIFWLVVLLLILPLYPDRFANYAVVPMSILVSLFLNKISSAYGKGSGLILLVVLFIIAFQIYFGWWYVFGGNEFVRFDIH